MKVGIFARSSDNQANNIYQNLKKNGNIESEFFDLNLTDKDRVKIDEAGIFWNNQNLMELSIAYIHGFSYMSPVIPGTDIDKDFSIWQADYLIDQQKFSFLFSLFSELNRRGMVLVNPPEITLSNFMKPFILEKIRASGFQVPQIICSNHMESVIQFCSQFKQVVWRPANGRALWQLFFEKQRNHLIKPESPPVLVAELIDGPLIRCYVYDGEPLLLLKFSYPSNNIPERLEMVWEIECPEVKDIIKDLTQTIGMKWGLVYFVLNNNQAWIYDIDPDPVFDWLPETYQNNLIQNFVSKLIGNNISDQPKHMSPIERPLFFLRRMLQILFEFEKSKYS